jgi:hypothetical protein
MNQALAFDLAWTSREPLVLNVGLKTAAAGRFIDTRSKYRNMAAPRT